LREETLLAARCTLTQSLIPSWFQAIELITATELLSLLTYHQRCGDAVHALRLNLPWITSHYGGSDACSWLSGQYLDRYSDHCNCGCARSDTGRYGPFKITEGMHDFLDLFAGKIDETIAQVSCIPFLWSLTVFVIDRAGIDLLMKWNRQECRDRVFSSKWMVFVYRACLRVQINQICLDV
jgi:hypothetical protein